MQGAAPDLIKRRTQNVGERKHCTQRVKLEVSHARNNDTAAHGSQSAKKTPGQKPAEDDSLNNYDTDDGHMLHDLVKADRVALQTEVGEDDKAHASDGELKSLAHIESFWGEDAETSKEE